jgi:hypothetical protein
VICGKPRYDRGFPVRPCTLSPYYAEFTRIINQWKLFSALFTIFLYTKGQQEGSVLIAGRDESKRPLLAAMARQRDNQYRERQRPGLPLVALRSDLSFSVEVRQCASLPIDHVIYGEF